MYTKIIQTVIAICLVYLCVKDINIVPAVHASGLNSATNVIVGNRSYQAIPVRIIK